MLPLSFRPSVWMSPNFPGLGNRAARRADNDRAGNGAKENYNGLFAFFPPPPRLRPRGHPNPSRGQRHRARATYAILSAPSTLFGSGWAHNCNFPCRMTLRIGISPDKEILNIDTHLAAQVREGGLAGGWTRGLDPQTGFWCNFNQPRSRVQLPCFMRSPFPSTFYSSIMILIHSNRMYDFFLVI